MGEDEDRSPPVKKFRGNSFVILSFRDKTIAVCRLQKPINELQSSLRSLVGNAANKFLPVDGKTFFEAFHYNISGDPFTQLCHKDTSLNDEEKEKILIWVLDMTAMCRQSCVANEMCLLSHIDRNFNCYHKESDF